MKSQKGVLSIEYHEERERSHALKYRLTRRTNEVLKVIKLYKGNEIENLCDIGTADGMMLDLLGQNLNIKTAVGLDFSIELLRTNKNPALNLLAGDALKLPFKEDSFDVVVATAVIEHVSDAGNMLGECWRILKEGGLCILTTPDPFFEHIATSVGHLKDKQHVKTFKLSELVYLLKAKGFQILKTEKFMMSPIGFPYEVKIERIMKLVKLDFLLLNQLVAAQKTSQFYSSSFA
ncbi:MAG: methyltransferase domain-containing protein [Dehalococcoidales bacterium]|nr:methyltransferase domain-containing protein [Dehalococcoidales bacterium]